MHLAGIRVVDAWIDHPNITALLFAGVPGQESGNAIADVLYGDVNPSARLPYTVARQESDYGALLNSTVDASVPSFLQSNFSKRLCIDYRDFSKRNVTPRYEFGFGLSYMTFEYAALAMEPASNSRLAAFPSLQVHVVQGGHLELWQIVYSVKVTVRNSGQVAGHEGAQLCLGVPNALAKQLRGFKCGGVLQPGESRELDFALDRRDLSIWNVTAQRWELHRGTYGVWVGASSRDIKQEVEIVVQ